MEFQCSACGECCRKANLDGLNEKLGPGAIYWQRKENGDCAYLTDEGKCGIYENRPRICQKEMNYLDFGASGKLGPTFLDKRAFFKTSAGFCNAMQERAGIDESFRLDVSVYDIKRAS